MVQTEHCAPNVVLPLPCTAVTCLNTYTMCPDQWRQVCRKTLSPPCLLVLPLSPAPLFWASDYMILQPLPPSGTATHKLKQVLATQVWQIPDHRMSIRMHMSLDIWNSTQYLSGLCEFRDFVATTHAQDIFSAVKEFRKTIEFTVSVVQRGLVDSTDGRWSLISLV